MTRSVQIDIMRNAMTYLAEVMTKKELIGNIPMFSTLTEDQVESLLSRGYTNRQILEVANNRPKP